MRRSDVQDAGMLSIAAQRKLIREQAVSRNEDKFLAGASTSTASLRGTMVRGRGAALLLSVCVLNGSLHPFTHGDGQIERYYTELFSCDVMNRAMEDQYVHMHSNRLCVVGVAASHPMMADEIDSVEFSSAVTESKVTGKKKKGGHFLLPDTVLCHVKCKSGKAYALRRYRMCEDGTLCSAREAPPFSHARSLVCGGGSCIRGSLIEVNERLLTRPQLLQEKVRCGGGSALSTFWTSKQSG